MSFLKCFIAIVIVVLVVILMEEIMELLYIRITKYERNRGGAEKFIHKVPKDLEMVNIGSGPGLYGISYDYCNKKGFNFSTAPQNHKYGFRLLNRFKDNIARGAIIIVVVMCPMTFGKNSDYDRVDYSDKYYGILKPKDIDGYSLRRAYLLSHPLLFKIINRIKNMIRKNAAVCENFLEKDLNEPEVISCWKREFDLVNLKDASQIKNHKEAVKDKIDVIENGIDFCRNNYWRPILVVPPVPPETRRFISDEFLNEFFYYNIENIKSSKENIFTLDYYEDERFTDDDFMNDIFLNKCGKEKFSRILFDDIANIYERRELWD